MEQDPPANGNGQPLENEQVQDGGDGPETLFLDDADVAQLQEWMDEEGDVPMDDEDDVEEVEELPEDYEGPEDGEAMMEEDVSSKQFHGHNNAVFSVSTHPTQPNLVVSGGEDDNGYIWRTDTGEEIAKLSGHSDSVICTGWSHDGELCATGGMDGRIRVWRRVKHGSPDLWEWARWEFLTVLEGMDEVTWLDWHPKGAVLVNGTGDGTVWMWQLPSGRNMNVFSGHTAPVTCGNFLPDGKRLLTASEDSTLIVWDPKSSTPIHKLTSTDGRFKLEGGITSIAFNASGNVAIIGGASGELRIVNLTSGQIVTSLENHGEEASVEAVAWSPGSAGSTGLWVSVATDKTIKVFEASNGALRWKNDTSHSDAITSLVLHPVGPANQHLVSTGSVDRTVKTWNLLTGQLLKSYPGHQDVIHTVNVSADARYLVTGSDDGTARVFEVQP